MLTTYTLSAQTLQLVKSVTARLHLEEKMKIHYRHQQFIVIRSRVMVILADDVIDTAGDMRARDVTATIDLSTRGR